MFERRHERLADRITFLSRLARHLFYASAFVAGSLGVGVFGYRELEDLAWVDALLNASMILGGMGPVDVLRTESGKLFASAYALYSGLAFLVVAGLLLGPIAHRVLHRFHLEDERDPGGPVRA